MELKAILESLVFASDKPLTVKQLKSLTGAQKTEAIKAALDDIAAEFSQSGMQLVEVSGGYQFRTHPDCAPHVKKLLVGRPPRLTQAMLETLAIIAYRQPITRPEIEDIRGVDCGGVLRLLLDRLLIRMLGKKEEVGRPILYGTTKQFLEFFNLKDLAQLPTLREFTELTDEMTGKLDPDDIALIEGGDEPMDAALTPGAESAAVSDGEAEPLAGQPEAGAAEPADAEIMDNAPTIEMQRFEDTPTSGDDVGPPPDLEGPPSPPAPAALTEAPRGDGAPAVVGEKPPAPVLPGTWARATVSPDDDDEDEAVSSLDQAMARVDEILRTQRREERARLRALVGETAAAAAEAAAAAADLQSGETGTAPGDDAPIDPDPDGPMDNQSSGPVD